MTTDTKYEEAKRCPKCGVPGNFTKSRRQTRPTRGWCTIEVYKCENDRCKSEYDTWIVQVNEDGSIPERQKGDKEFPDSPRMISMGQQYIDYLKAEEERGETRGGM